MYRNAKRAADLQARARANLRTLLNYFGRRPQNPGHVTATPVIDLQAWLCALALEPVEFVRFNVWYLFENV